MSLVLWLGCLFQCSRKKMRKWSNTQFTIHQSMPKKNMVNKYQLCITACFEKMNLNCCNVNKGEEWPKNGHIEGIWKERGKKEGDKGMKAYVTNDKTFHWTFNGHYTSMYQTSEVYITPLFPGTACTLSLLPPIAVHSGDLSAVYQGLHSLAALLYRLKING